MRLDELSLADQHRAAVFLEGVAIVLFRTDVRPYTDCLNRGTCRHREDGTMCVLCAVEYVIDRYACPANIDTLRYVWADVRHPINLTANQYRPVGDYCKTIARDTLAGLPEAVRHTTDVVTKALIKLANDIRMQAVPRP